jgi:membrane peptidoglycan carboxypeptidase
MSIGQEAGVTPLQMVTMYSALANGGMLYEPRIVHDVFQGNHHDELAPATGHRVLSERTARTVREILTAVVDHGTGKNAQLGGYTSAGKTGTAQKLTANGTYNHSLHIASFIGFAPATNPAVTILVVIDSPVGAYYGAEVAAPVFRSIAEQTLGYLNIPQDNPSRWPQQLTPKPVKAPDQKSDVFAEFLPSDRNAERVATSPVRTASFTREPEPIEASGSRAPESEGPEVVLGDGPPVNVPNFSGWPARKVALECERLGLDLNLAGSGLAAEQNPAAGTAVPSGTKICVRLAR